MLYMGKDENKLPVEYAKVTTKGMITIPANYRKKFGITSQDYLFFQELNNGNIKIGKVNNEIVTNGGENSGNNIRT